jgi:hypothetical protein
MFPKFLEDEAVSLKVFERTFVDYCPISQNVYIIEVFQKMEPMER